jgi:putative oxidoreductase
MKRLFDTNDSFGPLAARLFLAVVMFPHGAQKLLGWFGGYGFEGTMNFFTQQMHIPAPLALLAVTAEFFGPIALVLGLGTRLAAFGIGTTIAVAGLTVALPHGFFMNWFGTQKGEGVEYHLLMIGLALVLVIQGAGRFALDSLVARRFAERQLQPALGTPASAH